MAAFMVADIEGIDVSAPVGKRARLDSAASDGHCDETEDLAFNMCFTKNESLLTFCNNNMF